MTGQGPRPIAGQGPITPSTAWFGLAVVVALAGVVLAVVFGVRTADAWEDGIADFQRVEVPGTGTITVEDPGTYVVYYEYGSPDDQLSFTSTDIELQVVAPDGSEVALEGYDTFVTTYDTEDHQGEVLFSLPAEQAGRYQVTGNPFESGPRPFEGFVAVGRRLDGTVVGGVVSALAAGLGGLVCAVVITVAVSVKRSRERQRRRLAVAGPHPGWPPTAPGIPGPGPRAGAPPYPSGPAPGPWSQARSPTPPAPSAPPSQPQGPPPPPPGPPAPPP